MSRKLQQIWSDMKQRCYNRSHCRYSRYGARGIIICPEWKDDSKSFIRWALASGFTPGLTIDRLDIDKNYEPDNCRWATKSDQALNKSTNTLLTFNGETHPLKIWSQKTGVPVARLWDRVSRMGWDSARALTTPVLTQRQAGTCSAEARKLSRNIQGVAR